MFPQICPPCVLSPYCHDQLHSVTVRSRKGQAYRLKVQKASRHKARQFKALDTREEENSKQRAAVLLETR
jgi:hypothetical protein